MAVYSSMLSDSLVERRLVYIATCLVRVMLVVVRFVMAERSSAVSCDILENSMDMSIALGDVTVMYPPW